MNHLTAIADYAGTHIVGILLAILATYVIGFIWHGPLFGKQWMHLNKLPMPKKGEATFSMMLPGLSANFVMVLVQSMVLGRTFQLVSLANVWEAMLIATVLWLPFTALAIVNNYAWVGRPVKLMLLDTGYYLVCAWAIAAVLFATL